MSPSPRVARNLAWLAFGDAASRGGLFLYTLLVARALGPESFGVFSLAQSTALYVWIGVDLGVNLYGAREVAQAGDGWREVVRELLGIRLVAASVMTAAYVAGAALLAPEAAAGALMVSAAYLVANALYLDWVAKGLERFDLVAVGNGVSALAVLAGFAALVRPAPEPALAAGVWGSAYLAGALLLHLALARGGGALLPRLRPAAWRRHLSSSLFFAASGALLSALQYTPILALTMAGGFEDVGLFSASARVVTVVVSAGFLLPMAVYPAMSRKAAAGGDALGAAARRLQVAMASAGLAGGGLLYLAADPVVHLLYGPGYAAAAPLLRALAWIVPVVFVRYSMGSVLFAAGEQRRHALASLAGLGATLGGCAAAVPAWGPWGAAWAWLAGEAVVAVAMARVWARRSGRQRG